MIGMQDSFTVPIDCDDIHEAFEHFSTSWSKSSVERVTWMISRMRAYEVKKTRISQLTISSFIIMFDEASLLEYRLSYG